MAINRRQFLRTSLAGSAIIFGSRLDGMNDMDSQDRKIDAFDEQNPLSNP